MWFLKCELVAGCSTNSCTEPSQEWRINSEYKETLWSPSGWEIKTFIIKGLFSVGIKTFIIKGLFSVGIGDTQHKHK